MERKKSCWRRGAALQKRDTKTEKKDFLCGPFFIFALRSLEADSFFGAYV